MCNAILRKYYLVEYLLYIYKQMFKVVVSWNCINPLTSVTDGVIFREYHIKSKKALRFDNCLKYFDRIAYTLRNRVL